MKTKFYYVRLGNLDICVKGSSYAAARQAARAGKGRVVGVYFN